MKTDGNSMIMFDSLNEIREFLGQLGYKFIEYKDIAFYDIKKYLEGYSEEPYKRSVYCSAYLKDQTKENVYYEMTWESDYDWGNSEYVIYKTPLKKIVRERIIEEVIFENIKEG